MYGHGNVRIRLQDKLLNIGWLKLTIEAIRGSFIKSQSKLDDLQKKLNTNKELNIFHPVTD